VAELAGVLRSVELAPPSSFSFSFSRASTARARWSSHAAPRATPWSETCSRRRAEPPCRHARRRGRLRAPLVMPVALPCPPWHGGRVGRDLVAGNPADGEILPVNRELCSGLTDRWGQLTRWSHLSVAQCGCLCADPGAPNRLGLG